MDTSTSPSTPLRTGTLEPYFINCEHQAGPGPRGTTCPFCPDDINVSPPDQTVTHTTCRQAWHLQCWDSFIQYERDNDKVHRLCPWCRQSITPQVMYEVFDSLAHLVHTYGANALVPIPDQGWEGVVLNSEELENSDHFPFTLKEQIIIARLVIEHDIENFAVLLPDASPQKRFLVPLEDTDGALKDGGGPSHLMVSSFTEHPKIPELEFDPDSGLLLVDQITGSPEYRPLARYNANEYGEKDDSEREHNEGFHHHPAFDFQDQDEDSIDDEDDEDEASDTEDEAASDVADES